MIGPLPNPPPLRKGGNSRSYRYSSLVRCERGGCYSYTIFAAALGLIERLVGLLEDIRTGMKIPANRRYAEAHGNHDALVLVHERMLLYPFANSLGHVSSLLGAGTREHNDEFLSTEPAGKVTLTQAAGFYRAAYAGKHVVAAIMAIGVVDLLEVVDIEQHYGDIRMQRFRALELDLENFRDIFAIE